MGGQGDDGDRPGRLAAPGDGQPVGELGREEDGRGRVGVIRDGAREAAMPYRRSSRVIK